MKKEEVKRILLITLSNIGDAVLTTPCIDALRNNFPDASIHLMVSPNAQPVFSKNKRIDKLILYDKHTGFKSKIDLFFSLRKEYYDIVIDLRNTLFPLFLNARGKTYSFKNAPKEILSMKEKHLWKLKTLNIDTSKAELSVIYDEEDTNYIKRLLKEAGIDERDRYICVSPGAKSHIKRWLKDRFLRLCEDLTDKLKIPIVLIGDENDKEITGEIAKKAGCKISDFTGRTTIPELAALLKNASLLITNDSAPMHIGSAVNIPVLAIFGPTDPLKYGPDSRKSAVIRKDLKCSPCEVALCRFNHECMELISVDEVFEKAKKLLETSREK